MPPCLHEPCAGSGAWRPVLELRSRHDGKITHLHFTQVAVCNEHQRSGKIADYLSVEAFDKLVKILKEAGKKTPVRRYTTLDWESTLPDETSTATMSELTTSP